MGVYDRPMTSYPTPTNVETFTGRILCGIHSADFAHDVAGKAVDGAPCDLCPPVCDVAFLGIGEDGLAEYYSPLGFGIPR